MEIPELTLHIDVDAFFASVEQLLVPALRGRAVIVGCGVIASCSYEARARGLKAGMALHEARRLCPEAVVLEGDYQIYRCFAEHVWEICRAFTCGLETYLDEAYGDATGMEGLHGPPLELGRKLQARVLAEVGLPVSVGLAGNRMMAKIASSSAKPQVAEIAISSPLSARRPSLAAASGGGGQGWPPPRITGGVAYIAPGREAEFLAHLPIEKLPGVGHKTARLLHDLNIRSVAELATLDRATLAALMGARGEAIYEHCRGRDASLPPDLRPRMPKTISRETTFHRPICDLAEIRGMLFYLLERAMRMARSRGLAVGGVGLSIRYNDWKQLEARRTLPQPTAADEEVFQTVGWMLAQLHKRRVALRHVGIVLDKFSPLASVGQLFDPPTKTQRRELYQALDTIRDRFGHAAMVSGESIALLGQLQQNDYGFVLRTPSLTK